MWSTGLPLRTRDRRIRTGRMDEQKIRVRRPVLLRLSVLNSEAYKQLPAAASRMLPYFIAKVRVPFWDKEYYCTEFTFSYAEAEKHGCWRRTFSGVVKVLIEHGFIDPVRKPGRRGFTGLGPSLFTLSKRWEIYGTPGFENTEWECFGARTRFVLKGKNSVWQEHLEKCPFDFHF